MTKKSKQAYRQTPWRRQIRSMGISLLPVVALVVVATLHLIISAQAAEAGLQIMEFHYQEEEILRQIANQRAELAWRTSYKEMTQRAKEMGFEPAQQESIQYMVIPGYPGRDAVLLEPPPVSIQKGTTLVNENYQKSLMEWFFDTFLSSVPKNRAEENG